VIWKGVSRKTVFILGAGATRGAFSHVRVKGKKIVAPLNWDFFKGAKAFASAPGNHGFRERYDRIRKVFQEEFPTRGRWPIPMEEAFSLLYVSKDFPGIFGHRGPHRQAGARREIEDFLRLTFGILSAIEEKAPAQNCYTELVSRLESGDTILTLNYDTLLDSALVDAGWDPKDYGLTGGTGKITWSRQRPEPSASLANVKLLKLHGSLNWYVKGSFDKMAEVFAKKPSKVVISKPPRTNEFDGFVRQIIPPIYGKFFQHKHWQALWNAAHRALVDADTLVIIGCSLVDTDFHLSGMLRNAINRRKAAKHPFRLTVAADRNIKVRRKWLNFVRGCTSKKLHYPGFKAFAKKHLKRGTWQ
jgi:hypothetical protein